MWGGKQRVSRRLDTPLSQEGGIPASDKLFGTSYMCARSMRNKNQILHGDQTRCEENFYMVDHEC